MKRIVLGILMFCLLFIVICSCSRSSEAVASADQTGKFYAPGAPQANGQPAPAALEAAQIPPERLQVKNAGMSLEVGDLKKTETAVQEQIKAAGGYIAFSEIQESTASFTCKVPESGLDAFIAKMETLGVVKHKELQASDVTNEYFDLANRIKNRRLLLDRYQTYLSRAADTNELMNIERNINNLMTEIDSLEGSMKNLSNQITYSTLTLSVELPPGQGAVFSLPSFVGGLRGTGEFFLIFLYWLVIVFLYILAIGIPLLLLVGLVYFVGFGRIGVIVKFFKWLGPKAK